MDILEFAINMERDGEKYYRQQAELHAQDALKVIFDALAQEEGEHAEILERKAKGLAVQPKAPEQAPFENVFSGAGDVKGEAENPGQVDTYRMALEKEQESIDLYRKLQSQADGDEALYEFLIRQEEKHFEILEEVIKLVSRPKAWVESAEFGKREEY